jgi:L-ascorbate metabolism protein UlaG (beta-lactamase superfamily)
MLLGAGYLIRAGGGVRRSLGASWRRRPSSFAPSDHFDGRSFNNLLPSGVISPASMPSIVKAMLTRGDIGKPGRPIPLAHSSLTGPAAALAVTWLGHASALIEIDGLRVLADPVWSDRVSPSLFVGPKRLHPVPVTIDELPPLDAVIISHDHYDHLDLGTVQSLRDKSSAPFLVPIGVGDHLRRWGVPEDRIIELDWDRQHKVGALTFTCTQARHFSGRGLTRNDTLWSSWAIAGPAHRVFFGGDTGYTPEFAEIGSKYGPFDIALIPIGAYDERWADIHLNPEEAVQTTLDIGCKVLLPIHWATFDLAFHAWNEPVTRLLTAAADQDIRVIIPRPGQRIDAVTDGLADPWWQLD